MALERMMGTGTQIFEALPANCTDLDGRSTWLHKRGMVCPELQEQSGDETIKHLDFSTPSFLEQNSVSALPYPGLPPPGRLF